jgi:hypothetical protein
MNGSKILTIYDFFLVFCSTEFTKCDISPIYTNQYYPLVIQLFKFKSHFRIRIEQR